MGLAVYAARRPLLRALGEWWVVDEAPHPAEVIVVLGGDNVRGDRVRHAVELYRQNWAPRLLLSGSTIRSYFSEGELMQREATAQGVPAGALVLAPHQAGSTLAEALHLRQVLHEQKVRSLIVVTSNFHTRRTRRIFHEVFRRHGTQVWVSAASDVNFDPARWWEQREGRGLLFLELLKCVYTWWELWDVPPPPAPETSQISPAARPERSRRASLSRAKPRDAAGRMRAA